MSGIYGFWQPILRISKYEEDASKLMLWNKAYGNEEEDIYKGEDFWLGCCTEKLSIRANRSNPVLKRKQKYAVIDALLYNRDELQLKGQFTDGLSDEELLFSYIERFGMNALKDVNGDFCGAIYDMEKKAVTLFRDHMGIRPLFYYSNEECVIFSTDMRGLLAMRQVDVSINEKWLWGNITGDASMGTENTEFAHIHCVKPATYMIFRYENEKILLEKAAYWQLGQKKIRLSSEKIYIERLRELITDSVKRRLDAVSGQIGAELSGGLDSGVIDILIHRLGRECTYFSWSASPQEIPFAEHDERIVIEDICKQEKITCNYGKLSLKFGEESVISKKMKQMGLQLNMNESNAKKFVFPPYVNTLPICETSEFIHKSGAKVVFTGHGGDEGVSHRCNPYELFYHKEYIPYLQYMWLSTKDGKHRIYNTYLRCRKNLMTTRKILRNPYTGVFAIKELLNNEFFEKYDKDPKPTLSFAYDAKAYIKAGGSRNRLDVVALLGAYSGVRYIMPYLDYRVIDYAVSIPRHMYLKNQKNRYIFREAFKDIMPESLYTLDRKEDNSWNNLEREPQKEEDYLEQKKMVADMLDREYWSKYLNWETIDQWVGRKLHEADATFDKGMLICLSNCNKIQNIIERSRAVNI